MALTLTNLTLINGTEGYGGALLNEGDLLVLDNVTIRNSLASSAGGAIRDNGGTTRILNSLIENNIRTTAAASTASAR